MSTFIHSLGIAFFLWASGGVLVIYSVAYKGYTGTLVEEFYRVPLAVFLSLFV